MVNRVHKVVGRIGCSTSILASIAAMVLYPRAKWLFAVVLIGPAILVVLSRLAEDPPPSEIADQAQRLIDGTDTGYDVDDYEHVSPKGPELRDLWRRTMEIGGLPEEWSGLSDEKKRELQVVIDRMRMFKSQVK